jgi:hypothetical protein
MGFKNVDKLNKIFDGRKFHVCGPLYQEFDDLEECLDFYIEVIETRDSRIRVKLKVVKNVSEEQPEYFWEILGKLLSRLDYYFIENVLGTTVYKVLKHLGYSEYTVSDWEYIEPEKNNDVIQEQKVSRKFLRDIVRDIIFKIKRDYRKPKTYKYDRVDPGFGNPFDMEIVMNKGKDFDGKFLKPYDMEAFWDDDTDTLEVFLNIDPRTDQSFLYNLVGEFNDVISHELTHKRQYERGDKISKRRITRPETYYTQTHEVEAQMVGFKRKAKLMGKPLEDIIRDYFNKRRIKYNLTDRIIDRIVKKLMEHG